MSKGLFRIIEEQEHALKELAQENRSLLIELESRKELESLRKTTNAAKVSPAYGQDSVTHQGQHLEIDASKLLLRNKIGSGTSADVYTSSYFGLTVAVKKPRNSHAVNRIAHIEYMREIESLSKLRHPNIVLLFGICFYPTVSEEHDQVSQIPSLVIEFVKNGKINLTSVSKSYNTILSVARQISQAMAYAHGFNILHRDLKPSNLLYDEAKDILKISDWGLSKFIKGIDDSNNTGETGTFYYMAPEVIKHEPYSFPSDVYSFGIICWNIWHGVFSPYEYLSPAQAALGVVKTGLRPKVSSNVPQSFATLMQKCWTASPSERPSFSSLCGTIDQCIQENTKNSSSRWPW